MCLLAFVYGCGTLRCDLSGFPEPTDTLPLEMNYRGLGLARALAGVVTDYSESAWVECCFVPGTGKKRLTGAIGRNKPLMEECLEEAFSWITGCEAAVRQVSLSSNEGLLLNESEEHIA